MCLAFFDVDVGRWFCQDHNLRKERNEADDVFLCGLTSHFTNFAVLLSGNPNDSSDGDQFFTGDWRGDVSVAAGIALILLFVGAVIISVASLLKWKENRELKEALDTRTR